MLTARLQLFLSLPACPDGLPLEHHDAWTEPNTASERPIESGPACVNIAPLLMGERWGEEKRCSWVSVEQDVDMHDNIVMYHVLPNTQIYPNLT